MLAVVVVSSLFVFSRAPANRSGHFSRRLPPHMLAERGTVSWKNNPWRLIGSQKDSFYLAHKGLLNVTMRVAVKGELDTVVGTLTLENIINPQFDKSAWLAIDSNLFYLMDGRKGAVFHGNISEGKATPMIGNMPFFDKSVILGGTIYFRGIILGKGFVLGSYDTRQKKQAVFPTLLEKQEDGFFDRDGILLKDARHSRIIYLYNYRNQFIVMDSAMDLIYKGRTIDTVSQVHLRLGSADHGEAIKMATPPPTVNQSACIANGYLFVHSTQRADNEQVDLEKDASVIDVYDVRSGDYRLSFYIPTYKNEKIQQILVSNNLLAAMYPHHLRIFSIARDLFSQ